MAQPIIQHSFNSGEWAPSLNARVDRDKYRNAAALLRIFFVDYRGGGSSCRGTRYVAPVFSTFFPNKKVRLIPFQASFNVNYVLEFGDFYIRFHRNGAPILENPENISGITQANPAVVTITSHGYNSGDWVFISGVNGMTQVNGRFFNINVVDANNFSLVALPSGVNVNSTGYGAYTSAGTAQRVYTISSP